MKKYTIIIICIAILFTNFYIASASMAYSSPIRFDGYDYFGNWHPNYGDDLEDRGLFRQNIYTNEVEKLSSNVYVFGIENDEIRYEDWGDGNYYSIQKGNKTPKKIFDYTKIDFIRSIKGENGVYHIKDNSIYYSDFNNPDETVEICNDEVFSKCNYRLYKIGNYLLADYYDRDLEKNMIVITDINNKCIKLIGDFWDDFFEIGYDDTHIMYTKKADDKKFLVVTNINDLDDEKAVIEVDKYTHYFSARTVDEDTIVLEGRIDNSVNLYIADMKTKSCIQLASDIMDYVYTNDQTIYYRKRGSLRKINADGTDDKEVWNKFWPWHFKFYCNKIIVVPFDDDELHGNDKVYDKPELCEYFPVTYPEALKDTLKDVISLKIGSCDVVADNEMFAIDCENLLVRPIMSEDGRTLVPLRFITEKLGGSLTFNQDEQSVFINYDSKNITLKIGSKTAIINNQEVILDTAPVIIEERTMLPLRFISEQCFLKQVIWDSGLIIIADKDKKLELNESDVNILKEQFFRFDEARDHSGL